MPLIDNRDNVNLLAVTSSIPEKLKNEVIVL